MHDEEEPQYICKKVSFSKIDAQIVLNSLKNHSKRTRIPQRIYQCDICNHWHLTSINEHIQHKIENSRKQKGKRYDFWYKKTGMHKNKRRRYAQVEDVD
jgi:hypothetical protein